MTAAADRCLLCGGPLAPVPAFEAFARVTSDCRPWPSGGQLAVCRACALVQKPRTAGWRDEAARIYAGYAPYHQSSSGAEQRVFDPGAARPSPRSTRIVEALIAAIGPPAASGQLLDIGCGNGATLRAFAAAVPGWRLHGLDPHAPDEGALRAIPGFQALHRAALTDMAERFDLVSMVHVLEHLEEPAATLREVAGRLRPGGHLLIQVPCYLDNPYDLLIVDHCSHFTPESLGRLMADAGFAVAAMHRDLVPREITLIARPGTGPAEAMTVSADAALAHTAARLDWLAQVRAQAGEGREGPFGLFGTSIAATWLFGELGAAVDFFVDEDPSRAGTSYLERPVHAPADIPGGARVLMALARPLAEQIAARLARDDLALLLPPAFDAAGTGA